MKKLAAAMLLLASTNTYALPTGFLDLGRTTVDLKTGIEWLDTSERAGVSSRDVFDEVWSDEGLGAEGWQHVLRTDVWQLMTNWIGSNVYERLEYLNYYDDPDPNPLFDDFVATIGTGGSLGGQGSVEMATLFVSTNPNEIIQTDPHHSNYWDVSPISGHWLARAYSATSAPEPAALILLGLGLLGIRKRS